MRWACVFIALAAGLGCAPRHRVDRTPTPDLRRALAGQHAGWSGWDRDPRPEAAAAPGAQDPSWSTLSAPPTLEEIELAIDQFQRQRRGSGPALDSAWPPFLELLDAYLAQGPERISLAPLVRARVAAEYELDRELKREDGAPPELVRVVGGLIVRIERKVWALRTLADAASREPRPEEERGLSWPLSHGVITSGFGTRRDPLQPTRVRFHAGLDLAAPSHDPVYAAAAGTVVRVGHGRSSGRYVRLAHADGSHTVYAHLSMRMVEVGQEVGEGDVLGQVGESGRATGPHLHFALFVDGRAVDPLEHLKAVPMAFSDTEPGIVFGYGE